MKSKKLIKILKLEIRRKIFQTTSSNYILLVQNRNFSQQKFLIKIFDFVLGKYNIKGDSIQNFSFRNLKLFREIF